jgi:hypothetical protein
VGLGRTMAAVARGLGGGRADFGQLGQASPSGKVEGCRWPAPGDGWADGDQPFACRVGASNEIGNSQLSRLRACLDTRLFGWPRNTSEGKYLRSSLQSGQATTIGWNGNSLTLAVTSRRHRLQVTRTASVPGLGTQNSFAEYRRISGEYVANCHPQGQNT